MTYYHALTKMDEVVDVSAEWMRRNYRAMSCGVCRAVRPDYDGPVDVELDGFPQSPIPTLAFPVSLGLLRTDIYACVRDCMRGFVTGSVRVHDSKCTDFISFLADTRVRIKKYGRTYSEYSPCDGCGRLYQQRVDGPACIRESELGGLSVFTDIGGTGVYMRSNVVQRLPAGLRRELKLIKVSTCPE
jgi:hypothetical protein